MTPRRLLGAGARAADYLALTPTLVARWQGRGAVPVVYLIGS
jgi:hypothetical protein